MKFLYLWHKHTHTSVLQLGAGDIEQFTWKGPTDPSSPCAAQHNHAQLPLNPQGAQDSGEQDLALQSHQRSFYFSLCIFLCAFQLHASSCTDSTINLLEKYKAIKILPSSCSLLGLLNSAISERRGEKFNHACFSSHQLQTNMFNIHSA